MFRDGESLNCVEISESVYLRMASRDVREEVRMLGSITDELEAKIFERMFPAMTDEAIFWYRAGKGRGLVLCEGPSIVYVAEQSLSQLLQTLGQDGLLKAENAITSYDPHREAVIAVVRDEFRGIAVIGPDAADPLLQLIQ
jgi:hypothetical protein